MCDIPILQDSSKHKARKEHRCSNCHRTIKPGNRYTRHFFIMQRGDKPDIYKLCNSCEYIKNYIFAYTDTDCLEFDNIIDTVRDLIRVYPRMRTDARLQQYVGRMSYFRDLSWEKRQQKIKHIKNHLSVSNTISGIEAING